MRRRRGDVRAALLLLLAERPRNGYQLMQDLEERSGGRWRPSPGSVYPALAQLEDEGLVRSVEGESGRTYEITDAGRREVGERAEQSAPWEADDDSDDALHAYRHALVSTAKAAWQVAQDGDEQQITRATELLTETRRALYRLLAGDEQH
jgi:DNA-binding PadR family transcriptional regulator